MQHCVDIDPSPLRRVPGDSVLQYFWHFYWSSVYQCACRLASDTSQQLTTVDFFIDTDGHPPLPKKAPENARLPR